MPTPTTREKVEDRIEAVVGHCISMCPESEILERESQHLLHSLEAYIPTDGSAKSSNGRSLFRKADRRRMVKAYRRPAAGGSWAMDEPQLLRPYPVLLKTVNYLLTVFNDESYTWRLRYDFILDRLRAVRQDAIVQRLPPEQNCELLSSMLPFYFKSKYKCEVEVCDTYNWRLHQDQLEEILSRLDYALAICLKPTLKHKLIVHMYSATNTSTYLDMLLCRPRIPSGNTDPEGELWNQCMQIITALRLNDFYAYFKLIPQLPTDLIDCALVHVSKMRYLALQVMSIAFAHKDSYLPADTLTQWLKYDSAQDLVQCCQQINIQADEDKIKMEKALTPTGTCKREPHWVRCSLKRQ